MYEDYSAYFDVGKRAFVFFMTTTTQRSANKHQSTQFQHARRLIHLYIDGNVWTTPRLQPTLTRNGTVFFQSIAWKCAWYEAAMSEKDQRVQCDRTHLNNKGKSHTPCTRITARILVLESALLRFL